MSSHYFFRFGSKNEHFNEFYQIQNGKLSYRPKFEHHLAKGHVLAIYFGNFSSADVIAKFSKGIKHPLIQKNTAKAARIFYEAKVGDVFWLFLDDMLAAFKLKSDELVDLDDFGNSDCPAKCRYFDFLGFFNKYEMPDILSTTSSCILDTVQSLHTPDKAENLAVARQLLLGCRERIPVKTPYEALRFLSPKQIESSIFVLLHDNGYRVSSFEGGNKARVDLEILKSNSTLKDYFHDEARIQIKRTADERVALAYLNANIYFITLDLSLDESLKDHPYFMGPTKLAEIFKLERAKSASEYMKDILRDKVFEFAF